MIKRAGVLAKSLLAVGMLTCICSVSAFAGDSKGFSDDMMSKVNYDYMVQPQTNWESYKHKVEVKGIYVTANSIANSKSFERLLGIVKSTEVNAMVIDIKDDYGLLAYRPEIQEVSDSGLDKKIKVRNFHDRIDVLKQNNVYLIARVVTFKDTNAGTKRPDLALKDRQGKVWRDDKGNVWLNPFNKESWKYPISIGKDAVLNGFDEVQFDYVRFPTGGGTSKINYGDAELQKTDAIAGFLKQAKHEIETLGAYVSADVFGDIINNQGKGIGQNLEMLSQSIDVLCPMIYPSHYAKGSYGVPYPDSDPYPIIYNALKRAQDRINKLDDSERANIRPWLQDFSATWLKKSYGSNWISYKKPQLLAQIKAANDLGVKEWIFWNASNRYTTEAFKQEN